MKCPYCDGELEEGAVISQTVPQWLKKDEKNSKQSGRKAKTLLMEK